MTGEQRCFAAQAYLEARACSTQRVRKRRIAFFCVEQRVMLRRPAILFAPGARSDEVLWWCEVSAQNH